MSSIRISFEISSDHSAWWEHFELTDGSSKAPSASPVGGESIENQLCSVNCLVGKVSRRQQFDGLQFLVGHEGLT
jgi:hypothetical protein